MKIKPNFSLINVDEQYFVASADQKVQVLLPDERLVFLWNHLFENDCNKEQLLHALLDKYDISTVLALNDIDVFLKTMYENGIIEL